jgi:acyl transferase domain-containing protein/thioesterase domain-containing protein/NADP-dependent 3-hydroxy acid dehydrogenase YdfG/acyl carrier protein
MTKNPDDKLRTMLLRSVREVERLRTKLADLEGASHEPVAIVGVGLRAPGGVEDLDGLWTLLESERDPVRPIPASRWDAERDYDPDPEVAGKSYVREAAFVDGVEGFDPAFFDISPREAKSLDPQHRLLLESAWEALEHAGVVPSSLARTRTGVYVGVGPSEYGRLQRAAEADTYAVMGTHTAFAAGRLAFHLGLQGPAVCIDTACSSSLVALHLACAALRSGECELALAAGVQVMASPDGFIHLSNTRTVAPDGRCKTFSAAADGYGRGEGAVVLALERASTAVARGHRVLAWIRGSAINHDGASNGITAPNGSSQQKVLRAALADAELAPADVDVVECHGTGTELGDPIEVQALAAVYGEGRPAGRPLMIGTIKTNVGHLESAAGLAGVAKIVAAMQHGALPATLHTRPRNRLIDWDALGVEVVDELRPWPREDDRPRRAGVSAFGLSGTNAHVILEEAPELVASAEEEPATAEPAGFSGPPPVLLSARSELALRGQAARLRAHLDAHPKLELLDLAHSLATCREHFEHRACLLARDVDELRARLDVLAESGHQGRQIGGVLSCRAAKLGYLFTGQGAQRLGMGRALRERFEVFRETFDACCERFDASLELPLREVVFAEAGSPAAARLDETAYTQPALFAFELALACQLEAWGIEAQLLLGHSLGELAAAHFAGVFDLDDACSLVAARARLMQALPGGGAMVAIQATEAEIRDALARVAQVDLAAVNGPASCVISGDAPAVLALAEEFAAAGRKTKRLAVSHAFHSGRMEPMLAELAEVARTITYRPPQIPIVSNLTGALAAPELLCEADYWVRQVRAPVRFAAGVDALAEAGATALLELGPRPALAAMAAERLAEHERRITTLTVSAREEAEAEGETEALNAALGALHCAGVELDWAAYFAPHGPRVVELPRYAFVRRPYWLEASAERPVVEQGSSRYPLAGRRVDLAGGLALHTLEVGPALMPYLGDHAVYDRLVVPGSFYLAVLLAVAESHWPERAVELRSVQFIRALAFSGSGDHSSLHVELTPRGEGEAGLAATIFTIDDDGLRVERARAFLALCEDPGSFHRSPPATLTPAGELARLDALLGQVQIHWGPRWWWLREAQVVEPGRAIGRLAPPEGVPLDDAPLPCGFIDNSFGLQVWARPELADEQDTTPQLPFYVERMVWYGRAEAPALAGLRHLEASADTSRSELVYWDARGLPLGHIEGFTTHRAPRERLLRAGVAPSLYRLEWRSLAAASLAAGPGRAAPKLALVGPGARVLDAAPRYADLAAVLAGLDDRGETPEILVRPCFDGSVEAGAREPGEVAAELLADLRTWLADERLAATRLVVVTRRAVAARPEEGVADLARAPLWGMIRAAQAEHPERELAIVDLDETGLARERLVALLAVTGSEPQLAVRGDELLAPRLGRAPLCEADEAPSFAGDRTVLITGGTGALGSLLARHLVATHGVRRLMLLSRSGPAAPGADALRAELEAAGASVEILAVDVGAREQLAAAIASIPAAHPLGSVFHTAGVLADGALASLAPADFDRVFGPKLDAARHLHELTAGLELEHFVLFSSASGLLGSAGQANYAAANAYLDALAAQRRAAGLPALSLAWGPWAEAGMAARLSAEDRRRLRRAGTPPLSPEEGLALLDLALTRSEPVLVPIHLEREALGRQRGELPGVLWGLVARAHRLDGPGAEAAGPSLAARLGAMSQAERQESLRELVRGELAAVLDLAAEEIELERDLRELGLDSLMAIELRNRIQRLTGAKIPPTFALDHASCEALVGVVGEQLEARAPASEAQPAEGEPSGEDRDLSAVFDYLDLQNQQQIAARDSDDRHGYGVLQLLHELITHDLTDALAALEQSLLGMRRFRDSQVAAPKPEAVRLSGASARERIYLIPAFGWPSSPLQFAHIAEFCGDELGTYSTTNPGINLGDALPATLSEAIDYHLATYRRVAAAGGGSERPPYLGGYSSGGWLAQLVAARLEAEGTPAAGLVFLDSSHPFEIPPKEIKHMFIGNAIEHHLQTLGDDDVFLHELTGMLWLMKLAYDQWTDLALHRTPTLHIASIPGFDFPRWKLKAATKPREHWGPLIDELTVVETEVEHYQVITLGAQECAQRILAWIAGRTERASQT